MTWYNIIGILSTLTLLLPVILIIVFRYSRYTSYLALLIYCLVSLINNLFNEGVISVSKIFLDKFSIINNLLDTPLMLIFLMAVSSSKKITRNMKIMLLVFIAFEILVLFFYGLNRTAITIILGPGLLMIFCFSLYFFTRKVKQSLLQTKAAGKAVMVTAICFAYGCFLFIYLMHYILKIQDVPNLFLIYYMVTIIYSSVLSAGLIMEKKRIRMYEEAKQTREELKSFFEDEKKTATPKGVTGRHKFGIS